MKEGYKKTELGWIPDEWITMNIGYIFELSGGLSISREKLSDEGVYYLHYGDIHKRNKNYINVDMDKKWLPKIQGHFSDFKNTVKLEDGDVVFADASEDYEGIGKSVAILNEKNEEFVSGLHTIVGKDINKILDRNFKRFCFSTNIIRKQFRQFAVGATVYGISRDNLKKISILVPPLNEQQKIAEILSTVDLQIDDTNKLIEKTKELKKGLMQRLLTKGIGHSEFKKSEVGEIPIEWEVSRLKEVVEICYGKSQKEVEVENGKYKILGTGGIIGYTNEYLWNKPSVLIGRKGTIDRPQYIEEPFWTVDTLFYSKIKNDNNAKWLFYYISNLDLKKYNEATGVPSLSISNLNNIYISIPAIEEQQQIADILSSVDTQISEYENKKLKLEELKKGLMQQLLTGKIRVV